MADSARGRVNSGWEGHESDFSSGRKPTEFLTFSPNSLGQRCPQDYPQAQEAREESSPGDLGEPMDIREVAALIGCSVWTVRQQCLRQGLPHFRASRTGRLIFYRSQVVRWLIDKQTEGRW